MSVSTNMDTANGVLDQSRRFGSAENLDAALAVIAAASRYRGDSMNNSDIQNVRDVEFYEHEGLTPRNMVSSGSYVAGTSLDFSLTRNVNDFSFAGSNQQGDNIIVVTHFGLKLNTDIQLATMDEIINLGFVEIKGPGSYQSFRRPLMSYLMPKQFNASSVGATVTALAQWAVGRIAGILAYPISRPILIKKQETCIATLGGLTGTVAGPSPTLTMTPVTYGFILNNN